MKLSLVIPVYNEEDAIPVFYNSVINADFLNKYSIELIFINDGSSDKTEDILNNLPKCKKNICVNSYNFSRNFGKESALFAGLEHSSGDIVIPIDVDLQDPLAVIPQLIDEYISKNVEIVLAKRIDRSSDTFLKRKTAELFYKLHNKISNIKIEENVGDFRLLSRKAVNEIIKLPEKQLFMKGILSWVGFSTSTIEYTRTERIAGKTKFNGWKLWNLALEGITSFSTLPLRIWSYIGGIISIMSFLYALYLMVDKLLFGNPLPGYPSIMVAILFLGGIQLIGIGILGEYVGRIYIESKNRPRYIIKGQNDEKI